MFKSSRLISARRPELLGLLNPEDEGDPITQRQVTEDMNLPWSKFKSQNETPNLNLKITHKKEKGFNNERLGYLSHD